MSKTYILTGGSDGLGAAFGKKCIENGIQVICLSRSKPDYGAIHIPTDLSAKEDIEKAAKEIKEKHKFDALIHCAGAYAQHNAENIAYEDLENLFRVNVQAPIYLTSQLFDEIKNNNADILTIGSTIALKGYPNQGGYGASKWATRGLSQNLQSELKNTPCRVIQFNPGGMKTKIFDKFNNTEADLDGFMDTNDIADIMYYALSLPKTVEISEILINRKAA